MHKQLHTQKLIDSKEGKIKPKEVQEAGQARDLGKQNL